MSNKVVGRAALGFGLAWVLAIGSMALTPGCGNDAAERRQVVGTVDLALSGTSSSGILYRLRDAQIDVTGASSTSVLTEDHLNQTQVSLELPAGGYIADLLDGWRLERSPDGGMTFADVPAVLISTDPLPFTVFDQQTTDVRLVFRAGDDVVELGNGRVNIGIDVIDGMTPPPGDCAEACDIAQGLGCSASDSCFDICANLPSILSDPSCAPFAEEYMACAQGKSGEGYVCFEGIFPIAGTCFVQFQEVINCDVVPPPPPPPPPPNWTCDPIYFGEGSCDCGCGEIDVDCLDPTVGACEFCDAPGSCSMGPCPGNIDPNDNATCL